MDSAGEDEDDGRDQGADPEDGEVELDLTQPLSPPAHPCAVPAVPEQEG